MRNKLARVELFFVDACANPTLKPTRILQSA